MDADAPHPPSTYEEFAPAPGAGDHLVCVWTARVGREAEHRQTVLPDACVDILWSGDGEPQVAGPATRATIASIPPGTMVVGARFRPGGSAGVLGVDASALQDLHLPLRDVAPALAAAFSTVVADQPTLEGRRSAAQALLARHLPASPAPDALVSATVRWLAAHPAGRVRDLAGALHLGERQLQRRLLAAVGYAPKTLHRILRFQRLLALAAGGSGDSLSALALAAGYADQAHMTRELRDLSGRVPTELLPTADTALRMTDLFGAG
jgi:AraC-like DNA-binding protein